MKSQIQKDEFFSAVSEITSIYYNLKFKQYINQNSNVLDFGCSQGNLLELIKCANKVGVEVNKYSRKKLKLISKICKIKHFSDLSKIKGIKFDVIFALSVIDHVQNPAVIITKLKRLLKKNGKIIFIIRYDHINNSVNDKYKEHFFTWSRLSFSNFLRSLNLKVLECDVLKFTLPPKYYLISKIFGTKFLISLSKIYYYFSLKDKRIYFITKS